MKSQLPDSDDPSVTVYGFTSSRSDSLQLRMRDGSVVGVTFTRHDEAVPYHCAATACGGLTLGPVRSDGTRTIAFEGTAVVRGNDGVTAALTGDLLASDEGPPRPPDIECGDGLVRMVPPSHQEV